LAIAPIKAFSISPSSLNYPVDWRVKGKIRGEYGLGGSLVVRVAQQMAPGGERIVVHDLRKVLPSQELDQPPP
jgi:hypothetical protein